MYTLIIYAYLIGNTIYPVSGFASEALCQQAGDAVQHMIKSQSNERYGGFVCVETTRN